MLQSQDAPVVRITTSTTTTPETATFNMAQLVIAVSGAASGWTVTIQDKSGTPNVFYSASLSAGSTQVFPFARGIKMNAGMDIVTSGGTPGVLNVWYTRAYKAPCTK
jgi:hypothetical protein